MKPTVGARIRVYTFAHYVVLLTFYCWVTIESSYRCCNIEVNDFFTLSVDLLLPIAAGSVNTLESMSSDLNLRSRAC